MEQGYSSAHLALSLDRASYHLGQAERGLEVVEVAEEAQRLRCERRASLAVTHNAVMVVEEAEEPVQQEDGEEEEEPADASRHEKILRWGLGEDQGGLVKELGRVQELQGHSLTFGCFHTPAQWDGQSPCEYLLVPAYSHRHKNNSLDAAPGLEDPEVEGADEDAADYTHWLLAVVRGSWAAQ